MIPIHRLIRCAGLAALGLAVALASGCGQTGLPRGAVKGRVTIGDKPLASGRVLFLPQSPSPGPVVSAAVTGGQFELSRSDGPIAGVHRVEVEANLDLGFAIDDELAFARRGGGPLPSNPVPPEFNRRSQLTLEVKPGEQHTFDIALPAAVRAAARQRP
jgi:hypothetical protein